MSTCLKNILSDSSIPLRNYIAGKFYTQGKHFVNINPVDGSQICEVYTADKSQVDQAVESATAALKGDWGRSTVTERSQLLHRIADGIEERFDDFLAAEVADTGKPARDARNLDIPRGIANFRAYADLIKSIGLECYSMETEDRHGALNYVVRKPVGVVAVIGPWNLPLLLLTWKVAPALACGNCVVAKPSEETPTSATLLAEVMHNAGVPAGAFNLVHGFGPGSTGEYLAAHTGIHAITFTGESATGKQIMKSAADNVKSISFELGGKNAAIIFADADFEQALNGTARSTFSNCGQVCLCSERVYVHRSLFSRFVEELKQRAQALVPGYPFDDKTTLGPLISGTHREKVISCLQSARDDGANFEYGGGIPAFNDARDNGFFIEPTILTGLEHNSVCLQEEIFGPVCHITPFDDEEEVIALANDSKYGLAAALWTTNLSRAHRVARRIDAGIVWVNSWFLRDLRTPFGGMKLSGVGREGGLHSINFYTEPSNICIKI